MANHRKWLVIMISMCTAADVLRLSALLSETDLAGLFSALNHG